MNKELFAKKLSILRKERGWTQEQAASRIGIKRSRLGSYEESRALPPLTIIQRICKAFDIEDVKEFLFDPKY